jgi:CxxC-x17-CxxC domain-containing protein
MNQDNRRNSNFKRNNFSSEDREMHKTVCSKCQKECEVPFKPTEGKPVFCKECYVKKRRF